MIEYGKETAQETSTSLFVVLERKQFEIRATTSPCKGLNIEPTEERKERVASDYNHIARII